jgi:hypothetical protein
VLRNVVAAYLQPDQTIEEELRHLKSVLLHAQGRLNP